MDDMVKLIAKVFIGAVSVAIGGTLIKKGMEDGRRAAEKLSSR